MHHTDHCPSDPEETAEAYLLHHLARGAVLLFEDHHMTCARYAGIVEATNTFIAAMRRAAERLRPGVGGYAPKWAKWTCQRQRC